MARRQIGQEQLALSGAEPRGGSALDEVAALMDWAELDRLLAGISARPRVSRAGHRWRCSSPPVGTGTTFPTCAWPKLSMTGPAFAVSVALPLTSPRRSAPPLYASAPSWCAAAWIGPVRERSHVSSISAALWCAPARWSMHLDPSASIVMTTRPAGRYRAQTVHGYKASAPTGAGLIRGWRSRRNVQSGELEAVLPLRRRVYGDSASRAARPEEVIRAPRWNATHRAHEHWGGAEALARLEAHNAEVRRVRARIEKVFGTEALLRPAADALAGLAKAGLQVRLAAMAYNLRRAGLAGTHAGVRPARTLPGRDRPPHSGLGRRGGKAEPTPEWDKTAVLHAKSATRTQVSSYQRPWAVTLGGFPGRR